MSATAAVVIACITGGAALGVGVYRFGSWVLRTQDDREVKW